MPTQTTTTAPPDWYQGLLQSYYPGAFAVANQPYQGYNGQRVAGMSDITQGALGQAQGLIGGTGATQAGGQFLQGLLGGGQNPYMDQMKQSITNDATKAFQGQVSGLNNVFANPNSFGGARHELGADSLTQNFGQGLGQALGNLEYGAYNTNIQNQLQAAGLAQNMQNSQVNNLGNIAQMGMIPQQIQQHQFDTGYNDYLDQRNYNNGQTNNLANWLGVGHNAGQTSTTNVPTNNASQWLGGALLGGSALFGPGGLWGG